MFTYIEEVISYDKNSQNIDNMLRRKLKVRQGYFIEMVCIYCFCLSQDKNYKTRDNDSLKLSLNV